MTIDQRLRRLEGRRPDMTREVIMCWLERDDEEAATIAKAWADHIAAFGRPPRDVICISWDWRDQNGAAC
jgi:hypothetical protein